MFSGVARNGGGSAGPMTFISSSGWTLYEERSGAPFTSTFSWAMSCCTRERLTSSRRAVRKTSRRTPASSAMTSKDCFAVAIVSGWLRRSCSSPLHPQHSARDDNEDGDQLRRGHRSAEHRAPPRVAAQEFQEEARDAVDEDVRTHHLAGYPPLPPEP